MNSWKITFVITLVYFLLGNIAGLLLSKELIAEDGILFYLFFPYTIIWGLSALAGFDYMSVIFDVAALAISTLLFFPLGYYIGLPKVKPNTDTQ